MPDKKAQPPKASPLEMSDEAFTLKMLELANANNARMTGDMAEIWEIVNGADVVLGIWQEAGAPLGVGMLILKGAALLRQTVESQVASDYRVQAIKCIEPAQAKALADLIGEKDSGH